MNIHFEGFDRPRYTSSCVTPSVIGWGKRPAYRAVRPAVAERMSSLSFLKRPKSRADVRYSSATCGNTGGSTETVYSATRSPSNNLDPSCSLRRSGTLRFFLNVLVQCCQDDGESVIRSPMSTGRARDMTREREVMRQGRCNERRLEAC
jgi:hypothetical protein